MADPLGAFYADVPAEWLAFFEAHGLGAGGAGGAALRAALRRAPAEELEPPPALVFEAFRRTPLAGLRLVVFGRRPCASGLGLSPPPPLCAAPEDGAPGAAGAPGACRAGGAGADDLRPWAAQGVLLLGAALTGRRGRRGAGHRAAWRPFTARLVAALAARPAAWLLWGGAARAHAPALRAAGARVLEWGRDEGAGAVLAEADAALRLAGRPPVVWDVGAATLAFTDGACARNGRPGAAAGYAYAVVAGPLRGRVGGGRVPPRALAFLDPAAPGRGYGPTAAAAAPTNNRGEFLALAALLLALLRAGVRGRVVVGTDSALLANTAEKWLPGWRARGVAGAKKNYDLLCLLEGLRAALEGQMAARAGGAPKVEVNAGRARIEIVWVPAHAAEPDRAADPFRWLCWKGNAAADAEARRHTAPPALAP